MKEPDLVCSLLCDDVRREDNGKGILIGIFTNLTSKVFPFVAEFHVFNVWTNGKGEFEQETVITDPDGRRVSATEPMPFSLSDEHDRHYANQIFRIGFTRPGRYLVKTLLAGTPKLTLSFNVIEG